MKSVDVAWTITNRVNRRKRSMKRGMLALAVCQLALCGSPAGAIEYGFPGLNSVGRYFGVGWSHHSYHSRVDGRFHLANQRPACSYPSHALTSIYSAGYINPPPSIQSSHQNITNWQPPTMPIPSAPTREPSRKPATSILDNPSEEIQLESKDQEESADKEEATDSDSAPSPNDSNSKQDKQVRPVSPPKPSIPPPAWIKPYLENNTEVDSQDSAPQAEVIELDPDSTETPSNQNSASRSSVRNRYTSVPAKRVP
jgi:hypothetical protein